VPRLLGAQWIAGASLKASASSGARHARRGRQECPPCKVSLSLRKLGHPLHTEAEALCDDCRRRAGQPIGNTKCMIHLREVAVVENQNEVALA
jgi:hypothetical protein